MAATLGTGLTVTFASGFLAEMLSVEHRDMSRPSIPASHMGSSDWQDFIPGALTDPGEIEVELAFIPGTTPPHNGAAETVTITYPDAGAAAWAASGFLTGFSVSAPLEDRITATATIKLSGAITVTP